MCYELEGYNDPEISKTYMDMSKQELGMDPLHQSGGEDTSPNGDGLGLTNQNLLTVSSSDHHHQPEEVMQKVLKSSLSPARRLIG